MIPISPGRVLAVRWSRGNPASYILGVPFVVGLLGGVREICKELMDVDLGDSPEAYLLHVNYLQKKHYKKSLLIRSINGAKVCVPVLWKQRDPPKISHWFSGINEMLQMERMAAHLHGTSEKHNKIWFYWNMFVESERYKLLLAGS